MLKSFFLTSVLLFAQSSAIDPEFNRLKKQLEKYGFEVKIELPPQRGAYGLLESTSKTIWINPAVFDLGIARPTLIHEAVHAAQVCAGKGKLEPLGLTLQPINQARPFFRRYHNLERRDLEREAYTIQTQDNGFSLVLSLLKKHCQ